MQILIPFVTFVLFSSRFATAIPQFSIALPPGLTSFPAPPIPTGDIFPSDAISPDTPDVNGSDVLRSISGATTFILPPISTGTSNINTQFSILSETTQVISGEKVPGQSGKTAQGGSGSVVTPTRTSSTPVSSSGLASLPSGVAPPAPSVSQGAASGSAGMGMGTGVWYRATVVLGGALLALV